MSGLSERSMNVLLHMCVV